MAIQWLIGSNYIAGAMSILCDVFKEKFEFGTNIFKGFEKVNKNDEDVETDMSIESIITIVNDLQPSYENIIGEHSVQALRHMLKCKKNSDYNSIEGEMNDMLLQQADEMTSLTFGKIQSAYYPEGGRREIRRQKNKPANKVRKMGGLEKIEIDEHGGKRGIMRNHVPERVVNQYSDKGRCKTYIYVAEDNKEKEELWVNVITQITSVSKTKVRYVVYKSVLCTRCDTIKCTEWMRNSDVTIVTPKTSVPLLMRLPLEMTGIRVLWGKADSLRSVDLSDGNDRCDLLEVANFCEDESMIQCVTDDNEDVYLRRSPYICDMTKIVTRRVRAELASGMMIKNIDTFAVTVYQIEAY